MIEQLQMIWIGLQESPFVRVVLFRIVFTIALAGTGYWLFNFVDNSRTSRPIANASSGARSEKHIEDESYKSRFERLTSQSSKDELRSLLASPEISSEPNDDLATRLEKLGIRKNILKKFARVADTGSQVEQHFITQEKLLAFIEHGMLAQQFEINDREELERIAPAIESGMKCDEFHTNGLATVASAIAKVRNYALDPGKSVEQLGQVTDVIKKVGKSHPNNHDVMSRMYDFMGVVWDKEEFDFSTELIGAFCEGFEDSRLRTINSKIESLEKMVETRRAFLESLPK